MAIRSVLIAPEAAAGTAAASGYIFMRVTKWTPTFDPKLDIPRETTGSTIVQQRARPGPAVLNFSGQARMYFDMSIYWFSMFFGLPVGSTTLGAKVHTFAPGGVNPIPYTIQWKQTGSGGTIWRQATGCILKTIKLGIVNNVGLVVDFTGHGRSVTTISAPTPPSDTTAAYNQPMSMNQQSFTQGVGLTPWLKPKKLDITCDNGLTPDWSVAATRYPNRMKMGDASVKGDIQAFWDAYAGSLIEAGDSATQLYPQINYNVIDTTVIGTTVPSFTALLKLPFVSSPSEDDTNTDQEEKATLNLGYDSTLGSNASFAFTNMLDYATIYVGH